MGDIYITYNWNNFDQQKENVEKSVKKKINL